MARRIAWVVVLVTRRSPGGLYQCKWIGVGAVGCLGPKTTILGGRTTESRSSMCRQQLSVDHRRSELGGPAFPGNIGHPLVKHTQLLGKGRPVSNLLIPLTILSAYGGEMLPPYEANRAPDRSPLTHRVDYQIEGLGHRQPRGKEPSVRCR